VPELPDVVVYLAAIEARVLGQELRGVRLKSPFLVRTAVPPLAAVRGRKVTGLRRVGKRLVFVLGPVERSGEPAQLFLSLHLMIAGRLHWKPPGAALPRRTDLAAFDLENGCLLLTEAGTKKRAAVHVLADEAGLAALDRGGLEPLTCERDEFAARLRSRPHTVKRALCDPRILSGIGNAYSDEILHHARLSPLQRVSNLTEEELTRLFDSIRAVLQLWTERLRRESAGGFPAKVTAFRDGMAVHGRFGQPCPVCAAPIQRIVRTENEVNYCPRCQTEGKILKDRALSQLLKDDWPSSLDELEES
jgi:formamidopyrimidine-DNA glycosylase